MTEPAESLVLAAKSDLARVLVVDDDPILREFAIGHLSADAVEVLVAADGLIALEMMAKHDFDVALVDLDMPNLNGFELMEAMGKDPRLSAIPVVVITGRDDIEAIDLAYAAGATSFVVKPINWRLITYQLAYVLRNSRSEAAIRQARAAAEAASKAKSVFLANMSHEIRTPLNGVIGLAGALSRTDLTAEQSEMVGLIRQSGQTLERFLTDILDVSKIEAGKLTLQVDTFDLHDAIEAAVHLMQTAAAEKSLRFGLTFGPHARGLFKGDVVRIRQIISNLASNAVKFTPQGEVAVAIDVVEPDYEGDAATLQIKVTDTGIGFDTEARTRLFNRFEQADGSITRQFGGTGLGLSICKALADMMGGSIAVVSAPNQGSTFLVKLPLHRAMPLEAFDALKAGARAAEVKPEPKSGAQKLLRVLLAEDHPTNQRVVAMILEPLGVDLTVVENGVRALEAFQANCFDIVLMDMQMPEMDGLKATQAIRAYELTQNVPRTPIAMLSANAMREHVDQALAAGCDVHISKPITPESLARGIEAALARAQQAADHNPIWSDERLALASF
ncbi:autoinducer 2 sensor kinase/phosphatase LuxQ [Candidatus Phycosocius bacilliformis]|uniref:Sensory/regulatory protein RpfC n=1 Tax=Candidatus Phycosocius bacilliformis TaxID=1445552 RepID=A0A2P2E6N6_9PROT|nr:hybrid sensor histidine kinase/response regulator [Candidatus Phycosocius bacilliformis]GBF56722.1 autoinducer 2 sensor kinase/phosphatase LuxQ [Candidatus Phycosocius bacilliformis]